MIEARHRHLVDKILKGKSKISKNEENEDNVVIRSKIYTGF